MPDIRLGRNLHLFTLGTAPRALPVPKVPWQLPATGPGEWSLAIVWADLRSSGRPQEDGPPEPSPGTRPASKLGDGAGQARDHARELGGRGARTFGPTCGVLAPSIPVQEYPDPSECVTALCPGRRPPQLSSDGPLRLPVPPEGGGGRPVPSPERRGTLPSQVLTCVATAR